MGFYLRLHLVKPRMWADMNRLLISRDWRAVIKPCLGAGKLSCKESCEARQAARPAPSNSLTDLSHTGCYPILIQNMGTYPPEGTVSYFWSLWAHVGHTWHVLVTNIGSLKAVIGSVVFFPWTGAWRSY